ncbi:hypothetical protein IWX78_003130 [Mycetocola sp. CAN_C7]|uniref:hypothetical protein n=1 Tax=Mycetocola sp. CAN_C7 TaxID=2787724 RepID=UPI0018C9E33A
MSEAVSANDIRNNIRELLILHEQGRIVMTQDRLNTDFPESGTRHRRGNPGPRTGPFRNSPSERRSAVTRE